MKLDDELLALEAQLSNFCPREGVNLRAVLKDDDSRVSDRQKEIDSFVVLQKDSFNRYNEQRTFAKYKFNAGITSSNIK